MRWTGWVVVGFLVAFGIGTYAFVYLWPTAAVLAGLLYLTRDRQAGRPTIPLTFGAGLGAAAIAVLVALNWSAA